MVFLCPKCKKNTVVFFPDKKMNEEILRRKYVLNYDQKIKNLKAKKESLENEAQEWKNRYERESEKNTTLTKAVDRLSEKLEQLHIEIDENDKLNDGDNPLSS